MGGADFFVFQNSNDPKYQLSKNADLSLKKSLFSTNATFPFSLVQNTCIKAHKPVFINVDYLYLEKSNKGGD